VSINARRSSLISFRLTVLFILRRYLARALISFVCLSASTLAAEPQPERSVVAPLAGRSLLLDAARAGNRLVVVGDRGHVLVSDDEGKNWRQVQVPTRAMLTGVTFYDAKFGLAVGHDAVILRSRDGGDSWERVHYAPKEEKPLFDVLIATPTYAVAVGAYGYYLESIDGGSNWTRRELHSSADGADPGSTGSAGDNPADDFHLNAIVTAGAQRWYMAAEAGTVYRSDDAGQSWTRLPSPYEGTFFGVLPIATDTLLLFGLQGRLYRSEDGGRTWQRLDTDTRATLTNGLRLSTGHVVLVGLSGTILVGNKEGRSFRLHQQVDRRGIAAALAVSTGLILIGEGGTRELSTQPILEGF